MKEESTEKFLLECIKNECNEHFEDVIRDYTNKHPICWEHLLEFYLLRTFLPFYERIKGFSEIPPEIESEIVFQLMLNHKKNHKIKNFTIKYNRNKTKY